MRSCDLVCLFVLFLFAVIVYGMMYMNQQDVNASLPELLSFFREYPLSDPKKWQRVGNHWVFLTPTNVWEISRKNGKWTLHDPPLSIDTRPLYPTCELDFVKVLEHLELRLTNGEIKFPTPAETEDALKAVNSFPSWTFCASDNPTQCRPYCIRPGQEFRYQWKIFWQDLPNYRPCCLGLQNPYDFNVTGEWKLIHN